MRISAHSPWLLGYINVVQTILIILTMAGLCPDRPCVGMSQMVGSMLWGKDLGLGVKWILGSDSSFLIY